ncbi:MAG: PrsW family intramembrane metalloprotease [Haloarculaceae archaeon]
MAERDPIQTHADGSHDLYDVASWEPRTALDELSVRIYHASLSVARGVVVLLGVLVLLAILLQGAMGAMLTDPFILSLVVLSALPALGLAGYVYVADVTTSEPLELLVGTFILGVLFAGFAGVVNSLLGPFVQAIPLAGMIIFFYLVVGPVEETVKWLAVRLFAFRSSSFNAVIDGAVYGAAAGLGFATIENALYITQSIADSGSAGNLLAPVVPVLGLLGGQGSQLIGAGSQITALRALAGPGHVIYAAFSGYYLGLAKFNSDRAGPIVVKGLLIAAFIHATYNTLVGVVPGLVSVLFPDVSQFLVFLGFVLVYDGFFGYLLYRKISRYASTYEAVTAAADRSEADIAAETDEFDG